MNFRAEQMQRLFDERVARNQNEDALLDKRREEMEDELNEIKALTERSRKFFRDRDTDAEQIKSLRAEVDANSESIQKFLENLTLDFDPTEEFKQKLEEQEHLLSELRSKGASLTATDSYQKGMNELYDGFLDSALVSFEHALTLEKDLAEAWVARSTVLIRLKRFSEALVAIEKAIILKPNDSQALGQKAWILQCLGHFDPALAMINRAIEADPSNRDLQSTRAYIIARRNGYKAGLHAFEELLAENKTPAVIYFDRACIHALNGNREGCYPIYSRWSKKMAS